jgi:DNA-binding MurR/RpiR family transcriptional regulator
MMLNGGLVRIREALSLIKPAERNAAHYILNHPEEVVRLSVKELAEKSNSSQAAIIRLCKNLDLEGYQELKIRIAGDLQSSINGDEDYKEIRPNDNIPTLIESISNNNIYSIRETLKILDPAAVEKAVKVLHQANRIDFYGVAASQIIAQDAQQKFLRINKTCTAYQDSHLQLTSAVTLTKEDVAVGISYSGETSQVIEIMKQAKAKGATTIGITKYGSNSLAKLVDIRVATSSTESDIRSAATSSRIAQLNVIDILFTGVAAKNYDQSVSYLSKTREVIQEKFRKGSKISKE